MEKEIKHCFFRRILEIAICISLIIVSLLMAKPSFEFDEPYLEENSIVYHLDESGVVTSIEVRITNLSYETVKYDEFILRYCTEDSYPEGYTSPIAFVLNPMESRVFEISNFRNTWYYDSSYHIEDDSSSLIAIRDGNEPLRLYRIVSTTLFPVSFIALFVFIVKLIIEIFSNIKKRKHQEILKS